MQGKALPPVHLRAQIIDHRILAAGRQPAGHIAVLLVFVVVRVALGADAEPQGRVRRFHRVVHGPHQRGHIFPPPRGKISRPGRRKLRRVDALVGGGVEVIVKVDAVHRVVLHQLGHALHHIVGGGRLGGVQVKALVHRAHPLRVGVGQIAVRKVRRHGRRGAQAVGVDPRFHRDAPGVGFLQQHVQRVKARVLPLHAGAQMAPRKQTAAVQRIPEGAHLGQHCVQPQSGTVVQQLHHSGAEGILRGKVHGGPFQIAHPHGPPLPGRQRRVGVCRGLRGAVGGRRGSAPAQGQPCRGTHSRPGPQQKGAPPHAAIFASFLFPAAPGHSSSSCNLYRVSAAQPRAQASSTNSRFVQKASPAMPA